MKNVMKHWSLLAALLSVLFAEAGHAEMGEVKAGELRIEGAWARPSIGNLKNSAAYFVIRNGGSAGDRLVGVKGDIAKRIELHTTIKDGNIMRMRPVEGGVSVPKGGEVTFKPGGYHVMLIGLKTKLAVGRKFPLTLIFEKQGEVLLNVPVAKPGGARGSHAGEMMKRGSASE